MFNILTRRLVYGALIWLLAACDQDGSTRSQRSSGDRTQLSGGSTTVDVGELRAVLREDDDSYLSAQLNEVKRRGATPDALKFLEEVWIGDLDTYPDLAWGAILEPEARLNVIDILVQAKQNGEIVDVPSDAHTYVVRLVTGSSPVSGQAARTLASFDRDEDVALIADVAARSDRPVRRSAITALSLMCSPKAQVALDSLALRLDNDDASFIKDVGERTSAGKSLVCRRP